MTMDSSADPQAFARQIMEATNNLSDQEAAERYSQILAQLPPEQASELNALALSQVDQTQRRTLAAQFRQAKNDPNSPFDDYDDNDDDDTAANPVVLGRMSARAQQQDPALFGGMLGSQSGLGGQVGKAALSALAAILLRKMMNGQGGGYSQGLPGGMQQNTPMGGSPLGSILGGLLGGGGSMPRGGQQMPGGLDLGSILGGLLGGGGGFAGGGGGGGGYGQGLPQRSGQQMPGGLDLGSVLGDVLGGGAASRHTQQGGDLGSILGSILGGGGADDVPPSPSGARRSHRR